MSRNWETLILAAVIMVLVILAGGGKFIGMALLALLLPVYALALASVFLMVSIVMAIVIVPIGRLILDHHERKTAAHETSAMTHDRDSEWRQAA